MTDQEIFFTFWTWYPAEKRINFAVGRDGLLGYSAVELDEEDSLPRSLMLPGEYIYFVHTFRQLLAGKIPQCKFKVEMRHASGKSVLVQLSAQITRRGPEGQPLEVSGLFENTSSFMAKRTPPQKSKTLSWYWHIPSGYCRFSGDDLSFIGLDSAALAYNISSCKDLVHPDDLSLVIHAFQDHLQGKKDSIEVTARLRHRDKSWQWIRCEGHVVEYTKKGRPIVAEGFFRNITREHSQATEVLRLKAITDQVMLSASMSYWLWKTKTNTITPGPGFLSLLGYEGDIKEFTTEAWRAQVHPQDLPAVLEMIYTVLNGDEVSTLTEYRVRRKKGGWRWIAGSGQVVERDGDGIPTLVSGIIQDISSHKLQERELRRNSRKLEIALDAARLGTWEWDIVHHKIHINKRWGEMLGLDLPEEIEDSIFFENLHPEDLYRVQQIFSPLARKTDPYVSAEFRMRHRIGHYVWIFSQGQMLYPKHGTKSRWAIGIHEDISESKQYQENLERLATRDFLTGCGNRLFFDTIFEKELSFVRQDTDRIASMVIVDIDHFKAFNDSFGHDSGDLVLKAVSTTLMEDVGEKGLVARIGGEEFGIILPGMKAPEALQFMDAIRRKIRGLNLATLDPKLAGEHIRITAGVTEILAEKDQRTIFQNADQALYRGKQEGRDQVRMEPE